MVLAFDLDGTLFDNTEILIPSLEEAIIDFTKETEIAYEIPSHEVIKSVIGYPMKEIFKGLMPEIDMIYAPLMIDLFMRELVKRINAGQGNLYEGVPELLKNLKEKGYSMVIASNGTEDYINAVLSHYALDTLFADVLYVVDEITVHTKSDIVSEYKKEFLTEKLIMIGDRESDKTAALNNNIPFVFCAYGHASGDEISNSAYTAAGVAEIEEKINQIEKENEI
jgi:phosphoglycolate phosphatase